MKIIAIGLNYKNTPINIREKLACDAAKTVEVLNELVRKFNGSEFVLLSTCNRVEIYCACSQNSGIEVDVLAKFLSDFHNIPVHDFRDFLYVYNDADAVRHLLTVASTLDSMVVGESQIISQVKENYKLACKAKSTGKILNRLFHCAFATSKKILTQTSISNGRISVAGVAVELATQLFSDLSSAKVGLIGAGEIGELLVKHLLHSGCRNITIVNRSFERGVGMAEKYDIRARKWEEVNDIIGEMDIVIASASSQEYLFDKGTIEKTICHRAKKPLLIIDIAVPRNFAPDVNKLEGIHLYNIDELSEVAEHNKKIRKNDIKRGSQIIDESVISFMDWFEARDIGPVIGELKKRFTQIGRNKMKDYLALAGHETSSKLMAEITIHQTINELLHRMIKNVDMVVKKYGTAEAKRLINGIIQHAEEVLSEPDNQEQTADVQQSLQPAQMLRLLFWESTIKCNLACAHCRRIESNETAGKDLSTKQAKNLIEQLARLGKAQTIMPVLVFSGGEPLCRGDLFELIGHARDLGLACALATNGTLIDSHIAERIKDSGVSRVSISLDGATADVHNKLRKLEGSFEMALEGARQLHQKGIPFQINITLTKHNAHQLEDVYQMAKSLGAVALHIFMLVPVGCGRLLLAEDMLTSEQYEEKLLEICSIDARNELEVKVTCAPHYERIIKQQGMYDADGRRKLRDSSVSGGRVHRGISRGCLAGIGVLFVSHQGDVFPCGYLPVKCGNILKEQLLDIWQNNKDLAVMRDSKNLEGKCGVCGYKQICGGCRARAYSVHGNYMDEEPFCAYMPPLTKHGVTTKSKAKI